MCQRIVKVHGPGVSPARIKWKDLFRPMHFRKDFEFEKMIHTALVKKLPNARSHGRGLGHRNLSTLLRSVWHYSCSAVSQTTLCNSGRQRAG